MKDPRFYSIVKFILLFAMVAVCKQNSYSQGFPNPSTLSTGQGPNGSNDPIWQVSNWFNVWPTNTNTLTYNPAYISNNCAPGAWIDPSTLAPPLNNGNWISSAGMPCDGISFAYVAFRLELDLPADCNGNSLATAGNYVLSFDGYVDNTIVDVFINGVSENIPGLPGGSYAAGGQVTITLDGPWQAGINYVDIVVNNNAGGGGDLSSTGDADPYGLFLVANSAFGSTNDSDNDGVVDLDDSCPCTAGNNPYGCLDPDLFNCDVAAIRQTFLNAGCIEILNCANDCSVYFLNPQSLSGTDAQNFAQTYGANLISVQDATENQCIVSELNDMGQTGVIWIGFNDELVEGNFVWYDQSPVLYTNWSPGEPNNAGNEDYVQIYPNGMWNDLGFAGSAQSIIEVNLCPVITTGPDEVICEGDLVNLNASNTLFGSAPYSYSWNNGVFTQSNPVSPATTTEYIVTTTDRYDCTVNDTINVNVIATPTAEASYILGCLDFIAQFTDLSTLPNASTTINQWLWDFGDGNTSSAQNPTNQYANTGTYNVALTATAANNCPNITNFVVTVPEPTVVEITDNNPLCDPTALNWVELNTVSGNGATGSIGTDYTMTLTHSVGGMSTDPTMFSVATFPPQYNVPLTSTALRNDLAGLMTFCFNTPVSDPQIAFSSIGNPSTPVQIETSEPYNIIWNGTNMTYPNNTTMIGQEGFTIISFPGTHTCISFNYLQSETYCTIAFGIQDTNCQVKPEICAGESVDLTASGALDYVWTPAAGLNTTSGANVTASPTVTTTYYAQDANDIGCSYMDSVIVIVHELPEVIINQVDVCDGAQMTFTSGTTIGVGTLDSYEWDFGDAVGSAISQDTVYTYNSSGDYTVLLSVTSNEGCVGSTDTIASVFDNPIANFTVTNACDQSAAQFVNTTNPNGSVISSIQWDYYTTGIVNYTGFDGSNVYPSPGSYFVSQYVTTANGCRDTSIQEVNIFPSPDVNFTATNVCEDNSVAFVNNTTIASGLLTNYAWDFANGNTSNLVSPSEFYGTPGVYLVSLTVRSDNNCEAVSSQLVEIYPTPNPQFIPNNVCLGNQASFVDFSNVQSAGTINSITGWNWDFGVTPTVTSGSQFPSFLYPQSGTFTVTLEVTTNHNCVGSVQQNVTIYPNPVVDFSSPVQMGCTEFCADFINESTITSGVIDQYYWNFGNGNISTDENPTSCYVNQTLANQVFPVSLTATSNQGCATTATMSNFITVFPLPQADFEPSTYLSTIYQTDIDFTNLSTIGDSYFWTFDELGISIAENPSFTFPFQDSGRYEICLLTSSMNGCLDSICKEIVITPASNVYVPNAFTPNGDGINDLFIPVLNGISEWEFNFIILDRWGLVLYESSDPTSIEWDGIYQGANVPFDTYVWKIEGVSQYDNSEINRIGHVSVIR